MLNEIKTRKDSVDPRGCSDPVLAHNANVSVEITPRLHSIRTVLISLLLWKVTVTSFSLLFFSYILAVRQRLPTYSVLDSTRRDATRSCIADPFARVQFTP